MGMSFLDEFLSQNTPYMPLEERETAKSWSSL